jgi:transcription-repair coupling factor (superfamily II helicase)
MMLLEFIFFGDEIEEIESFDVKTAQVIENLKNNNLSH